MKTLFESARLKITLQYLVIIMIITALFSSAFYQLSTRELQRLINRVELEQRMELNDTPMAPMRVLISRPRNFPSLDELKQLQHRSLYGLIIINGVIVLLAGVAGYYLAGRTLQPINSMMSDQQDFISNASHELRTPIAILRAELESNLLEKKLSDAQARALIKSNLEEIETLQVLTNKLLRVTQLESSPAQPMQKVSVASLIDTAHQKVAPLARRKHITLHVETKNAQILAQPTEITEVLLILLENAIKYSPAKTKISLTTQLNEDLVTISVKDQGVGIAETDLPHVFKRFYRADKSRSRADGFGLGLSIARRIVDNHHGTLSVTSQVGRGSTFTLLLPRQA